MVFKFKRGEKPKRKGRTSRRSGCIVAVIVLSFVLIWLGIQATIIERMLTPTAIVMWQTPTTTPTIPPQSTPTMLALDLTPSATVTPVVVPPFDISIDAGCLQKLSGVKNKVAFSANNYPGDGPHDAGSSIFLESADGKLLCRLTDKGYGDALPAWSPDGKIIAFSTNRPGGHTRNIFAVNVDGSNLHRVFINSDFGPTGANWSPNSKQLTFVQGLSGPDISGAVYVVDSDGANLHPLTFSKTQVYVFPKWSPDGKYVSYVTVDNKLYLLDPNVGLQAPSRKTNLSVFNAIWSPDGKQMALMTLTTASIQPPYALYILDVESSKVRKVMEVDTMPNGSYDPPTFTWSPDGRFIAMAATIGGKGGLFTVDINTGEVSQIFDEFVLSPLWSPDGNSILFGGGPKILPGLTQITSTIARDGSNVQTLIPGEEAVWAPN
jgi:Tol biopolymer transport system component